ncbi:unnamed protein product [Lupinus luteus]|uniref:RRM domain-containing protein n=1 Tax=Lupinus luteus TaxID=3873 RepID=A0AAV1X6T9_LUPLU
MSYLFCDGEPPGESSGQNVPYQRPSLVRTRTSVWGPMSSFYVTNFPEDFRAVDLWRSLQSKGNIVDVFIPSKRNRSGQRFAFVRFNNVQDERNLTLSLDNVWLGSLKLCANVPRFKQKDGAVKSGSAATSRPRKGFSVKVRDGRSYAEAVRGKGGGVVVGSANGGVLNREERKVGRDPLVFDVVESELDWLHSCYIGRITESVTPYSVQGLLLEEGILSLSVCPLGGNLVLLVPKAGESVKKVLSEAPTWSAKIFCSVYPWSSECVADERLVWIRCFGLPLHAWNEGVFGQIAKVFGTLVEVDEASIRKVCLEFCRMLIQTPSWSRIEDSLIVNILDKEFTIHVREEWAGSISGDGKDEVGGSSYVSDSYGLGLDRGMDSFPGWLSDCVEESFGEEDGGMVKGVNREDERGSNNVESSPKVSASNDLIVDDLTDKQCSKDNVIRQLDREVKELTFPGSAEDHEVPSLQLLLSRYPPEWSSDWSTDIRDHIANSNSSAS